MKELIEEKLFSQGYGNIFKTLSTIAEDAGAQVYLVGGAVRDLMIGREVTDLDFVVFGCPYDEFAKRVAKSTRRWAVEFKDNMRIPVGKGRYIDISAPRGRSIEEDLAKRDFTINNLAVTMDFHLVGDPTDIQQMRVVPVFNAAFDADPLRIVRGFRMVAMLGFELSPEFKKLARAKIGLLANVAGERIYEELRKFSLGVHITQDLLNEMAPMFSLLAGDKVDPARVYNMLRFQGVELSELERFVLMLAAMFGDCLDRERIFETLKTSKAVGKLVIKLIESAEAFAEAISGDDMTVKRAVWDNCDIFKPLIIYTSVCAKLPEELWQHAFAQYIDIQLATAELFGGKDILEIAAMVAPQLRTGPWIAQIMTDVNFMLTFKIIEQSKAHQYITEQILLASEGA